MDFWTRQADARRRSRWLVVAFLVAVLAIIIAVFRHRATINADELRLLRW